MEYRQLGSTELKVSAISLGTWAIGGHWGRVDDEESIRAIYRAIDLGVNFFDTADVYGDGRSEELLRKTTADKADEIFIATKFCRAERHPRSRKLLGKAGARLLRRQPEAAWRERIDLYQIHCPPTEILRDGSVFEVLDKLQRGRQDPLLRRQRRIRGARPDRHGVSRREGAASDLQYLSAETHRRALSGG